VIKFVKEIEIKLKIDDNIVSKLKNLKLDQYEEIDEYSTTKEMLDKRVFLRFRNKEGKTFLEFKIVTLGGKDVGIYEADEIKTELTKEQYGKLKKIFSMIFPINIQIKKIRSRGKFGGCELCYDKVDGLGDFLEIEGPREKIVEICEKFNIDVEKLKDREEGYVFMALKRKGLI
jgi:adenylate cyclase class IV